MLRALIAFCLLTTLASAQLYTLGNGADDNIREIDPATGMTLNTIPVIGASGNGFNGMAQDPLDDRVYVIEGGSSNCNARDFGTLDIATGQYTLIGNSGRAINSLAFDTCGNLFALEGQCGVQGDLYAIDKNTGAATFLVSTGVAAGFGTAVMFEPATGLLIAYSGCPSAAGASINPVTLAVTPLAALPMTGSEIQGGAPSTAGDVFVTDFGSLFRITSAGTSTLVGPVDHSCRGIVEFANISNNPGTGEDLVSVYGVNGGPQTTVGPATDVVTLLPGDSMFMAHASFGGTFVNVGELASVGSLLPGGAKVPFLFPGIHINIPTAFLMSPPISGIPPQLPSIGFIYAFTYGGGALAGIDMMLQGFVLQGILPANGIFASTDGLRVELR